MLASMNKRVDPWIEVCKVMREFIIFSKKQGVNIIFRIIENNIIIRGIDYITPDKNNIFFPIAVMTTIKKKKPKKEV
jgi:hypothetical protein